MVSLIKKNSITSLLRLIGLIFLSAELSSAEYLLIPKGYISTGLNNKPWDASFHSFLIYQLSQETKWPQKGELYRVVNSPMRLTRTYEYLRKGGDQARLVARLGSGSFLDSCKCFDLYDVNEEFLGYIEANEETNQSAEFYFYDSTCNFLAIATLDEDASTLRWENHLGEEIASCKKFFSLDFYHWYVEKKEEIAIDDRVFWPFLSFIAEVWWLGAENESSFFTYFNINDYYFED